MGETVVIKGVDDSAYRNLKGEAIKAGLKVGEAASQAFRLWVQGRMQQRVKESERLKRAAAEIDRTRASLKKVEGWSSVEVIRKWRTRRRP
jgi:hypothetical protein